MANIGLVEQRLDVVLGELSEELVALESEGLGVESVVVLLADLVLDGLDVLVGIEVFKDAVNLVI